MQWLDSILEFGQIGDLSWNTMIVVAPLLFLSGFVDSIAGGGGLISLPAFLIVGFPVHLAIGTNKLCSCMGTLVATVRYATKGYVNWRLTLPCFVTSFIGACIGAKIALAINERVFLFIMLFILPATLCFILCRPKLNEKVKTYDFKKTLLLCLGVTFVLGIYEGVYGPGNGTFLILAFLYIAHMSLNDANGLSKSINVAMATGAIIFFLMEGKVWITYALIGSLFTMSGNYIGASLFLGKGVKIVQPIMITVMGIFLIRVIYDLFFV